MRSSSVVYRILYRFFAMLARLAVRSGRPKGASTCHQIDPMRRSHKGVPKRTLTSHDRVSGTHTLESCGSLLGVGAMRSVAIRSLG
jgi:hypothetical protein